MGRSSFLYLNAWTRIEMGEDLDFSMSLFLNTRNSVPWRDFRLPNGNRKRQPETEIEEAIEAAIEAAKRCRN
jgi:hypothetical protein